WVGVFASTKQFAEDQTHVSKLLFTPLVPQPEYSAYRSQQDRLSARRIAIDELASAEAEKFSRTQCDQLADYMLAARRIYEGEEAPEKVLEGSALDKDFLARWVRYLGEGSKAHPQLADWDNAAAPQQKAVALAYQQRYTKMFNEWAQVMDRWRTQVRKRIEAMDMPPPPKPAFEAARDLFFYEIYIQRGPFNMGIFERQKVLSQVTKDRLEAMRKEEAELRSHALPEPDMACAVAEGKPIVQKVLIRGDYNSPGEDAPKAFPKILAKPDDPAFGPGSGRREMAEWIASPANPLTARVMVNRVWSWHFGEGLVRTPDNFGKMGDRPSHPELLDYLARKFIESGWSLKALNRMIVLSAAYQTSSDADEKTTETDPENRLLAHFNRQRLDVEAIRDGMLALDGSLDFTMGGTLQKGFGTDGENSANRLSIDPLKVNRRTVYLPLRRANLPTLLNLFDFGDATTVNGKRNLTNVAPQTLFAMNSEFGFERARNVAEAVLASSYVSDSKRLEAAYVRVLNRKPSASEVDEALTYLNRFEQKYPGDQAALNAWKSYLHILLASNEFFYVD
ncbi:MAG: DUF1553 domain-containing protein, partial [Acidobacteriaceae bacterium]|nr:DUF1553 domain-containing protein [Acidobacteriaceae bacterium]